MASPYDIGHAMRRRNGTPSNYFESAGPHMTRTIHTADEHYAKAVIAGSARVTYGAASDAAAAQLPNMTSEVAPEQFGTMVPKNNTQSQDPTGYGAVAHRTNVLERMGAQYRVTAHYSACVDPVAAETMNSARLVPSVHARNTADFGDAMQGSMY